MIKKIADQLFKWYCHPDFYPDIKGDLEELYSDHLEQGLKSAQWKYCVDVLLLFRLSLLRPIIKNSIIKDTGMFKNYFKISVRSLARHKMFTAINVVGLAIGLASFLLMFEYIKFEKGYDSFHNDADKIYRVSKVQMINGVDADKDAMCSHPTAQFLEEELPEVTLSTVSKKFDFMQIRNGDTFFRELNVISADPNFLKMFNYPVLEGDKETMLSEPETIVLTESRAKAYFGSTDPMGQFLEVISPYKATLKVTGILKDIPDNTHYKFDMLISDKTLASGNDYNEWGWDNYYVYITTGNVIDKNDLTRKANIILNEFMNDPDDGESWKENGTRVDIHNVLDIHLREDFSFEPQVHGSEKAVNFLIIISVFILLIAWVNYINLSTARALERAKEVGIRKVIGAFRKQLIIQFLCEAFLVNLIGGIIALILAQLSFPYFNELVGKEILTSVFGHSAFITSLLVFVLIGTFASGFYPALVLSDFKPITILKGKFKNSKRGVVLRKGLVIVQFAASLILIAATFTIYQQVNYMQGRDIGISVDQVVNVTIPESDSETEEEEKANRNKIKSFKEELRNHYAIEAVGATSNLPGGNASDINSTTNPLKLVALSEAVEGTTYIQYNDEGFLDALDMELIVGRNFDPKLKSDSVAVMVNEALLRKFNVADFSSVINEKVQFGVKETKYKFTIVGVVKDFNRTSLKSEVEPTLYFPSNSEQDLVIELKANNYKEGMEHLEATWTSFYPNAPFGLTFLDQRFAALYDQDRRFGDTFMVFAFLAIFIAILGLYGLASFLSIQRSKEVGVRKVLGASSGQILYIFYKDFFSLIAFSAVFGFPTIYFLMDSWLNNYAFRIEFPWLMLVVSLVIVSVFAFGTVGYQILKVAKMNPAQTLQYE
jgi:putative ABC transport system permease protein